MRRKYKFVEDERRLATRILVYLTEAEGQWLEGQAEGQELSRSAYLRSLLVKEMQEGLARERRAQGRKEEVKA